MELMNDDIQMWDLQVEDCYFLDTAQPQRKINCYRCDGEKTPGNAGMIEHAYALDRIENKNTSEPCSQSKRRRVLEFESVNQVLSQMSNWLCQDNADASSLPSQQVLDQSFQGWLSSCLTEEDMDASGPSSKSIGTRNLGHVRESTAMPERPNIHIHHNSNFGGKKSNIRTSDLSLSRSVVKPFTLLKSRDFTGDEVTLKDINRKIHSPQKIQEDCIEYSAFSGKPVVSKTKIWTKGGKGSITIMRTKG